VDPSEEVPQAPNRALTIAVHALVLAVTSLASIVVWFSIYRVTWGLANPTAVPIPIAAAALTVVGFFSAWLVVCHELGYLVIDLDGPADATWIYLLAVLWAIALLMPLHFLTQTHLPSMSNIIAAAVFQGIVNIITVPVAVALVRFRTAK
jgi:hypothetical protein